MADVKYQRDTQRFDFIGVDLNRPVDSVKPGKLPYALNIRSYLAGRIEPRDGLINLSGIPALPNATPSEPPLVMNSSCPVVPDSGVLIGVPYSFTPSVSGGLPPYTWTVGSGSLPPGLTIPDPSTGVISGTPTTGGTYNFTLHVTDSGGVVATTSGCSITVGASMIMRPTYVEEFEDNPPVNPIRSRIINGANAADTDDATTFAQCQFDSSRSLTPDYANLQLSVFRPLPPLTPVSIVVHGIVEYIQSPIGGPHHASSIFNARNVFVDSADEFNNFVATIETDQNSGVGPGGLNLNKTEFTHTFTPSDFATFFSSNWDNVWVRCYQTDTLNYDLPSPAVYNIYGIWIEVFF